MQILSTRFRRYAPALILAALVAFPVLSPSSYSVSLLTDVFIFAVFAMSYDLLMGYTGIVSFGHTLFFGTGAYSVAILLTKAKISLGAAVLVGSGLAVAFGLLIGALSLRVKDVYFSMVTLAFAELGHIAVQKWSSITGGADGLTGLPLPAVLESRAAMYYAALVFLLAAFLLCRRLVDSPFGRTLVGIRENEVRAAMIGYNVFAYKLAAIILAGLLAALAGMFYALSYAYVSPQALAVDTTINVLLMTIIGGAGTLAGPVLGAGVVRILGQVLSSFFERWLLVFGLIYVLTVIFLPRGIMGARWRLPWFRRATNIGDSPVAKPASKEEAI
ncbi:MAG: branched-chain amino acid ABC transporter permease [Actinobacteria bacterium]|nr:branched-chain amino acid ABC transporter permease [Actinomycetota bacterium]